MNEYRHHVSGFFAHHVDAEYVFAQLLLLGLPRERLYLLETNSASNSSGVQGLRIISAMSPFPALGSRKYFASLVVIFASIRRAMARKVGKKSGLSANMDMRYSSVQMWLCANAKRPGERQPVFVSHWCVGFYAFEHLVVDRVGRRARKGEFKPGKQVLDSDYWFLPKPSHAKVLLAQANQISYRLDRWLPHQ